MDVIVAHGSDISIAAGFRDEGYEVCLVVPEPAHDTLPDELSQIETRFVPVWSTGIISQAERAIRISRTANDIASRNDALVHYENSPLGGIGSL
ncbi:MAG: hypothetical protein ABEI86_05170, partial [Halobacteriaceae archaeon]